MQATMVEGHFEQLMMLEDLLEVVSIEFVLVI